MRVLLVDDDAAALEMMRALFASWGYTVDSALTGRTAIELVKVHCPDFIISDLIMPGMSGLELLKALKTDHCKAVFIMLTGYGTVRRGVEAIEAGADEVLLKPLDVEALRTALVRRGLAVQS